MADQETIRRPEGPEGKEAPAANLQASTPAERELRAEDTYAILRSFSLKHREARIQYEAFLPYVQRYCEHYLERFPRLEGYQKDPGKLIVSHLQELQELGRCNLLFRNEGIPGSGIAEILFPSLYVEAIQKVYREIEEDPETPFPTEDSLKLTVPNEMVSIVDIRKDFTEVLSAEGEEGIRILRLIFPENVSSLVITSNLIARKLLEYSLAKIRLYMNGRNVASFVQQRLLPAFPGSETVLREMISSISSRPGKALASFLEPSEFSFRFWAHFANLVLQEFKDQRDLKVDEHGLCQSLFLIGYYNVYFKSLRQKEVERTQLLKDLETAIKRPPYAFSLTDLYGMKDLKKQPLIPAGMRDVFQEFMQKKLELQENEKLPELIRLHPPDGKDVYIHRDLVIPFFVKKLYDASEELKRAYSLEWQDLLRQSKRTLVMTNDQDFHADLHRRVKSDFPILFVLLNYPLLRLAREGISLTSDLAREMSRCLDDRQAALRPLGEMLGLERKEIYDDARLHLPFLDRFSPLKNLVGFIKRILLGIRRMLNPEAVRRSERAASTKTERSQPAVKQLAEGEEPESGRSSARAGSWSDGMERKASYRRQVVALKEHFVGKETSLPRKLEELIERWNPLMDARVKANLVEDVNSMIRDFWRGLKKGFRVKPPDAERISALAEKLARNPAFSRITRKEYFQRYIEIYMIKLLGEK